MAEEFLHSVLMAAKTDETYQKCLAHVRALEPAFLEIRSGLTPENRDLLDRYIAACEAMDDALLALAIPFLKNG